MHWSVVRTTRTIKKQIRRPKRFKFSIMSQKRQDSENPWNVNSFPVLFVKAPLHTNILRILKTFSQTPVQPSIIQMNSKNNQAKVFISLRFFIRFILFDFFSFCELQSSSMIINCSHKTSFFSPLQIFTLNWIKCFCIVSILFAVCREWIVREDNALAQQLQSQESEFSSFFLV